MLPSSLPSLGRALRAPLVLTLGFAALLPAASPSLGAVPSGFIDVTAYGAIPDDGADDTAALQAAINDGRDQDIALWFPGGDYLISDRLDANQEPDHTDNAPIVLRGSTIDPQNRARIILKANSPGFGDPANRKVMLHFFNTGTAENEGSNTTLFNHAVIGMDFKIESGNDGAVAVRMQGAEGCSIQDVRIDLTEGGHTGIWGIPGSGGSTHEITVTGGRMAIDTRLPPDLIGGGSQPGPVVTGATLLNQSECAVYATTRGPLVMVGAVIKRDTPGPLFKSEYNWQGQPFDGGLQLVDCRLEYASHDPGNVLIKQEGVRGRSFHLDNTYLLHGEKLWTWGLAANPGGWRHFKRTAQVIDAQSRNWAGGKDPEEPVWVDGVEQGKTYNDSADSGAPPADLQSRHQWPADFPTWEHPGVVDVTTLGAVGDNSTDNHAVLQQAIDNHEILFFPKGKFRISDTLDLKPDTKLIGVHHKMSILWALSSKSNRFGDTLPSDPDKPMIRTADTADAQTWIAGLHIRRETPLAQHDPTPTGNYALEWRSGGESLLRMVDFDGTTSTNLRPDLIARNFYGYPDTPDPNPNHPQQFFAPGEWAWPVKSPTVQVRGNGGGKIFGFWLHGRQGLRETTPLIRVENTSQPIHFYHFHIQQQDSENHAEFINAHNVSVYNSKAEIKGTFAYFENCTNVRYYGHTGISGVDQNYFEPYLFRFINCEDFLIAGINDTITEWSSGTKWIGGAYDRWLRNYIKNWNPILDQSSSRPDVISPWWQRPVIYLRGNPAYVPHAAYTGGAAALVEESFTIGAGAGEYAAGQTLDGQPAAGADTGGWDGPWWVNAADPSAVSSESGGLTYTGIPGVTIGGSGGNAGHASGGAEANRPLASAPALTDATTLWLRLLWQPAPLDPADGEFFNLRSTSGSEGRFTFRRRDGVGSNGNDLFIDDIDAGTQSSADFPQLADGQSHLLLFKVAIDRSGSNPETVDLWINPTTADEGALGAPDASVSGNILDGSQNRFTQFDFTGTASFLWDELAIGESFAGVIPSGSGSGGGGTVLLETGTVQWTRAEGWDTVTLSGNIGNPVVVMSPSTFNGGDAGHARVRNVTPTSFEYQFEEWAYLDGQHGADETFHFIVMEAGEHDIAGLKWEARKITGVTDAWQTVNFNRGDFGGGQIVLAQTVTTNDPAPVVPRLQNVTASGFDLRVQEEEAADGAHAAETVAVIAVSRGTVAAEAGIKFFAETTGDVVTDLPHTVNFPESFANPSFFGQIRTYDGPDPAGLRLRNLTADGVEIQVEEEASLDLETTHTDEEAGYLIIGDQ